MHVRSLLTITGVLVLMLNTATSVSAASGGIINFKGRIFGAACDPSSQGGPVIELKGCPAASRGNTIHVHSITDTGKLAPSGLNATLIHDSERNSSYYDQQYRLINKAGEPVHSGTYLITMTSR